MHSNYAKKIVNTLIVARFQKKAKEGFYKIENSFDIAKDIKNITFGNKIDEKLFARDLSDIGKHFVVQEFETLENF